MKFSKGDTVTFKLGCEHRGIVEDTSGDLVLIHTWSTTDDPDGQLVTIGKNKVWLD